MTDVELLTHAVGWMQDAIGRQSHLGAFALLYLEESGIPLPAPGDVFVIYVGVHVPLALPFWFAAWLGLICVVVLGATNLYLVSRVVGRRVLENRFARLAHLTPARLALAESRFQRRGVLAIIFGRHIPGFRVPITVAAGILRIRYVTFALSVAVSTAIWAGAWLVIGIAVGGKVESFLHQHRQSYWLVPALTVLVVMAAALHHVWLRRR